MSGTIAPFPKHQFFDNNGDKAVGYKLFSYTAGTSTKYPTYTDVDLATPNANPIVLDSAGRCTIFLAPVSYKFVLAPPSDTDPPTSPIWTIDNVSAVPPTTVDLEVSGTAGENLLEGQFAYMSQGDGSLVAGRWYLVDSANTYKSSTANVIGMVTENINTGYRGTFRLAGTADGQTGLTKGTLYYVSSTPGGITSSPTGHWRQVGVANDTTSIILSQWLTDRPIRLAAWTSDVGNVGAGEDTLASLSISAGKIGPNNAGMRVVFFGHTANNANAKVVRLRAIEGANDYILVAGVPTVSQEGEWIMTCDILRTGTVEIRSAALFQCGITNTNATVYIQSVKTNTPFTWTNAIEIRATGQGVADNDVVMNGGTIDQILTTGQ